MIMYKLSTYIILTRDMFYFTTPLPTKDKMDCAKCMELNLVTLTSTRDVISGNNFGDYKWKFCNYVKTQGLQEYNSEFIPQKEKGVKY